MFHLFYGENPTGELKLESNVGTVFWSRIEDVKKGLMPSVPDLLNELELSAESKVRFFIERNYAMADPEAADSSAAAKAADPVEQFARKSRLSAESSEPAPHAFSVANCSTEPAEPVESDVSGSTRC